jgi:hypothetical protein
MVKETSGKKIRTICFWTKKSAVCLTWNSLLEVAWAEAVRSKCFRIVREAEEPKEEKDNGCPL